MALQIKPRGGVWYVMGRLNGVDVKTSTGLSAVRASKADAEARRIEIERNIVLNGTAKEKETGDQTLAECCRAYCMKLQQEGRLSKNQWDRAERVVDELGRSTPINKLTTSKIFAMTSGATWAHKKPDSVIRDLQPLTSMLKLAVKLGELDKMPDIVRPRRGPARTEHLEANEARHVLDWLGKRQPFYYPHFLVLTATGVRLGELLSLTEGSFKIEECPLTGTALEGELHVFPQKAATKTNARVIPLNRRVLDWWPDRKVGSNGEIFIGKMGAWSGGNSASAILNKILKEALARCRPHRTDFTVHDLRHTFAYLTAQAGADLGDLQKLLGHSDISQTMRYRGFVKSRAVDAIAGVAL